MAYHRPLDAYEEYIVRKREAEAETLSDTASFKLHRPPWNATKLALDELDLTKAQWVYRIIMGIICIPIFVGLAMFFPPERVNVLYKDLWDVDRYGPGANAGGGTHVVVR